MSEIKELYEGTSKTLQEIADDLGVSLWRVWKFVQQNYSPQVRQARKVKNYARSKTGVNNPMFGKTGEEHHNYIGEVSDHKGYLMIVKPSWYTGRKRSKHVFVHHVVICEHRGLTEIPTGWCVHHKDENKLNNRIENLELMTISNHTKLHQAMRLEEVSPSC